MIDTKYLESFFDITWAAVDMMHAGEIDPEDSRELFATVCAAAQEFETNYTDDDGDYLADVEQFTRRLLLEKYGEV